MDFTSMTFVITDEEKEATALAEQVGKQAHADKIMKEMNAETAKRLKQIGMKLVQPAFANRLAKNPVTQEQYNARRFVIRAILREPQRALTRYPIKDTWAEMYKHVPYWDKATSAQLQQFERLELKEFSKEVGVYSRKPLKTVQDFILLAELAYKTEKLEAVTAQLQEYRYLMDKEANAIIYKGHILKYSSRERAYLLKLGTKTLKITEGNVRKQQEVFEAIDQLEALCD